MSATKKATSDTLHLVLKAKWYDMIASGEKKSEYREINKYWLPRFCYYHKMWPEDNECKSKERDCLKCFSTGAPDWCCYPFEYVVFHRGYSNITMTYRVKDVCFGYGKPKWGAPVNRQVFIIKLAERI